jgi:nickel-dependent lactate racemase
VAGSCPCDIEFWQAHKSLYPANMAVRDGGTIILVTPCPEGVSQTHAEMLNYTSKASTEILDLVERGQIGDRVSGALALAWARVREHAGVFLVSPGISDHDARALGFRSFSCLEEALGEATWRQGPEATVLGLTHAPDTLPIVGQ